MKNNICRVLIACLLVTSNAAFGQVKVACQSLLDSFRTAGNFPALSVAVYDGKGDHFAITSGLADKEKNIPLLPSDAMMQGSVGKTYAAALALQLAHKGRINLDEKVSRYLGHYPWFSRVPNAAYVTVRMLMNHSSGIMRYEFKPQFLKDLTANPDKEWTPAELIAYVLDEKPAFEAGDDWEYSDTNYILLGMIIEAVTGKKYYDLLYENILLPHKLENTFPSDGRNLKKLVPGYAGSENEFGGKDKVIDEMGQFIINPQFEWTGGGIYSTTEDLARWGKLLYEGKVVDTPQMIWYAVPAKLGKETKYGLGVIIRRTPLGVAYGHSGFFPGYMTEMLYFPADGICVAVQTNSSDFKNLKVSLLRVLVEMAKLVRSG